MNPRTLRALLPALREARDAGVRRIAAGEGKNRVEFELTPADPAPGEAIAPGTDETSTDDASDLDPNAALAEHYRIHGARANGVAP